VRAAAAVLAGALAVSALSALVVAPAPSYDPWMWLLWGREVAHGTLSTVDGPAFKPLPVAVCALLAPLGAAAPAAWVILARAGALVAVWLAGRLAWRVSGSRAGAVAAAVAVGLCAGWPTLAATGAETGWVLALALAGAEAWRAGRARAALACGLACALLRVEAWPFLLAFGVLVWRRRPQDRPWLAACAAAVPALWFLPELAGSGDVLRSGARARVPNPGQPALADVPAWASLRAALGAPPWAVWPGVVAVLAGVPAAAARARPLLAAGAAWILVVAAMAQAGFSGEPRYALPGAALVAVAGVAGLARVPRVGALVAGVLVVAAVAPRAADLPDLRRAQAYQARLATDLETAVAGSGGRDAVLACGRPYTGRFRGPLLAYRLGVEKRVVGFEPRAPGVVFRSRLRPLDAPAPAVPAGFGAPLSVGPWSVRAACQDRRTSTARVEEPAPSNARRVDGAYRREVVEAGACRAAMC
jgi:hypothetical protein